MSDTPEPTSKKLEAKRARRLAEERKAAEQKRAQRRRSLITTGLAIAVAALVIGLIVFQKGGDGGSRGVTDIGGPETPEAAGCTDPEEHPDEGHTHVAEGTPIDYKTDPPTSGDHWPPQSIADTGFYATPVENERLVHNMEHGQIVIWYKNSASQDEKDKIEDYVNEDPDVMVGVPYDFDGPGTYVMTSWRWSMNCETPSQTVMDQFRKDHQGHGREAITPTFTG
ncbi:MAG: hypothetical protein QOH90_743 [Actinomycetota bacterium]|nr:hypothetical protein [Actinomycetota bacterium]